jgi:uncharacterized protein YkwD
LNRISTLSLLFLLAVLAACGGGTGDTTATSQSVDATTAAAASVAGTTSASPTASTPTSTSAPPSSASLPAAATCALGGFQQQVLGRVNQARASGRMCGSTMFKAVAPLAWNALLFNAAAGHAQDMAANNYFSHVSQDGRTFSQRIGAAGYTGSAIGENIAAGQASVDEVMDSWLQSPGHCENIMNGSYTEVAVACASNDASAYRQYWVMELGRPQ